MRRVARESKKIQGVGTSPSRATSRSRSARPRIIDNRWKGRSSTAAIEAGPLQTLVGKRGRRLRGLQLGGGLRAEADVAGLGRGVYRRHEFADGVEDYFELRVVLLFHLRQFEGEVLVGG